MEPEGITRAWPMVPLISKKTSATQNHAMISRWTFCPTGTWGTASLLRLASALTSLFGSAFNSAFMFHRHGILVGAFTSVAIHRVTCFAARNAIAHFKLHQVRGIHARVARRAVTAFRVAHRLLQSGERNVA